MNDLLHTFHDVLGWHGLVPEKILADGTLHRIRDCAPRKWINRNRLFTD